jgi:hypothetical protein
VRGSGIDEGADTVGVDTIGRIESEFIMLEVYNYTLEGILMGMNWLNAKDVL